ncbi:hypothetical protein [Alkaliphilus hydrothermalis]|uniref:DUF8173 domain-containing protein n=1 Tax=Alkaliphilus hydrothermalis TaxID=1482730 RepID=A0ABS2NR41_9FIRM|nr:hypothetical protein [Alkaliphilus hydrothermalis]MBM7615425.1 hypothetical protein [Alkaliphilus hydrothermalis]
MERSRFRKIIILSFVFILLTTAAAMAVGVNTRGEVVSFFREINIPANTQVRGSVVSIFGDVDIQGNVMGDTVAIFGRINVDGKVYGDTISVFGGITVGSSGEISGDGVAVLGYGIHNYGAIRGQEVSVLGFAPVGVPPLSMLFMILLFFILIKQLFAFGFSVVAVLIFKERFDCMATGVHQESGKKFFIGLLVVFGTFVGMAVLAMTVIGAPLIVLLIPALSILEFLGNTVAKIAIGRKIAQRLQRQWSVMMELLMGTLIYVLLEATLIGKVFTLIFKFIGIGEIVDSRLGDGSSINRPKGV